MTGEQQELSPPLEQTDDSNFSARIHGFLGMPRRIFTYEAGREGALIHLQSVPVKGAGFVFFVVNLIFLHQR